MRRKKRNNQTVMYMKSGFMTFKRRVDIPMWHQDHIKKAANILREYADRIEAVTGSNSMRNADKTLYAQSLIREMNKDMGRMTPKDPRERGTELLRYTEHHGLVDERGFDELNARDDMKD